MAKENDEVQHSNNNSCISNRNNNAMDSLSPVVGVTLTTNTADGTASLTDCVSELMGGEMMASGDKGKVNSTGGGDCAGGSAQLKATTTFMRSKLNDLVADLCINGPMGNSGNNGGYGDYTNRHSINIGQTGFAEGAMQHNTDGSSWETCNSSTTTQPHVAPTSNPSSFSFKHFLSSSQTLTAPSSTVTITSLDTLASSSTNGSQSNNASASSSSGAPLQTSTGARPKVPQSASLSSTSISSLMTGGLSATTGAGQQDGGTAFGTSATKMKRSPRFSSFDSQASLAEYASAGADAEMEGVGGSSSSEGAGGVRSSGGGTNTNSGFRLYTDSSDFFASSTHTVRGMGDGGSGIAGETNNANDYDRHQYVPRSYSNYEMPMSSTNSPRRRAPVASNSNADVGGGCTKEARPTRLALNTNTSKLKVHLHLGDMTGGACGGAAVDAAPPVTRPLPSNAGEFPAAVLPDFVQDHWLDSWYAHDMHLNSPPNSPIRDFSNVDVAGGAVGIGVSGDGGVTDMSGGSGVSGVMGIPGPSPVYCGGGACGGGTVATAEATASNAKMLPDFLSDGPIIHSSQRLADVAVGLPSNSIGSPDDSPMPSQLSRLRIENERLQRELNDSRISLNEQTRRANELERQLLAQEQKQRVENAETVERGESLTDKSKNARTAAATSGATPQNYVIKLKQQVAQLTSELEMLRRENESLREEGAVGGLNIPCCDRSRPYAKEGATGSAAGASVGARGTAGRPSKTQQISRDLLRAASTAENNLKQLLAGVDNLRQMAADIENSEIRLDYDVSPDLFSDFLDDCDDYEDYSGGPAL